MKISGKQQRDSAIHIHVPILPDSASFLLSGFEVCLETSSQPNCVICCCFLVSYLFKNQSFERPCSILEKAREEKSSSHKQFLKSQLQKQLEELLRTYFSYIIPFYSFPRASLVAQMVKNLPAMQETRAQVLGWEAPMEKGMATHSWTEEPGGDSPWGHKQSDTTQ